MQLYNKLHIMNITAPKQLNSQTLLAEFPQTTYGTKFKKFSQEIAKSFDKLIRISIYSRKQDKDKQILHLSAALFLAVLHRKKYKVQFQNYYPVELIQAIKNKCRDIRKREEEGNLIVNYMMGAELDSLRNVEVYFYVELMRALAERKEEGNKSQFSQQQLGKISAFFKQQIVFLNYDASKQAADNLQINHKVVYLLKAKEEYFILLKTSPIRIVSEGYASFQQLISIFNIDRSVVKKSTITQQQKLIESTHIAQTPEQNQTKPISLIRSISQNQILEQPSMLKKKVSADSSRLKQSVLFPDSVKCSMCSRNISQFNALFWNYSHLCFQCIVVPQTDVSYIPPGLIQKFLKARKYEAKEYHISCPECQSQIFLSNYKPWDKPKKYRCKACQKAICIQHEGHINTCFCYCSQCDRQTITIPKLFIKYCLSCNTKSCHICNKKTKGDCECICKNCGQNSKVDHNDCHWRCHSCLGTSVTLMNCGCGRKLCSMCLFKSLQANSRICLVQY